MHCNKQITIACFVRAAAATALFAVHIVAVHSLARAQVLSQMPDAALLIAPDVTPVAAPAGTPAAMPAVEARGSAADAIRRVKAGRAAAGLIAADRLQRAG